MTFGLEIFVEAFLVKIALGCPQRCQSFGHSGVQLRVVPEDSEGTVVINDYPRCLGSMILFSMTAQLPWITS